MTVGAEAHGEEGEPCAEQGDDGAGGGGENEEGNFTGGIRGNLHDGGEDAERAADGEGELQGASLHEAVGRHGIGQTVGTEAEEEPCDGGEDGGVGDEVGGEVFLFHARLPMGELFDAGADLAVEVGFGRGGGCFRGGRGGRGLGRRGRRCAKHRDDHGEEQEARGSGEVGQNPVG